MATIDLTGTYTSTDGEFTVDLSRLSATIVNRLIARTMDHVFGNEAISKASTAKAKNGGVLSDDEYAKIVGDARVTLREKMYDESWGDRSRTPRSPGANRLEQIFNMLCATETRAAIAKMGLKAGEDKDTWISPQDGQPHTLTEWMGSYLGNPQLGPGRRANLDERAKAKLEQENRDAELRKAAKAREASAAPVGEEFAL